MAQERRADVWEGDSFGFRAGRLEFKAAALRRLREVRVETTSPQSARSIELGGSKAVGPAHPDEPAVSSGACGLWPPCAHSIINVAADIKLREPAMDGRPRNS